MTNASAATPAPAPAAAAPGVAVTFGAKPIGVMSHPRSGTHLMIDGLRHFFRETHRRQRFNQPVHDLYVNIDRLERSHPYPATESGIRQRFEQSPNRLIIKSHCTTDVDQVDPEHGPFVQAVFDASDIVYVVRDVRPVLASFMALRPLKYPDSPTDLHAFLRAELDGGLPPARGWAKHVAGWLDRPGIHVAKFEDMKRDYAGVIEKLGRDLGLTRNGRPIRIFDKPGSILENKIRRILGIQHCSSLDNLRMKLKTPNWRDAMTDEDLALIREQAGEVMERVGYRWEKRTPAGP